MGKKKNGKKKREMKSREKEALAAVIEWLRGSLQDMTFLLNDATADADDERRTSAGYFLGVAIREAASAAADVLEGDRAYFDPFAGLEAEASAEELLSIARIRPIDPNGGNERQERLKGQLLAMIQQKITKAASISRDSQWIAEHGARVLEAKQRSDRAEARA